MPYLSACWVLQNEAIRFFVRAWLACFAVGAFLLATWASSVVGQHFVDLSLDRVNAEAQRTYGAQVEKIESVAKSRDRTVVVVLRNGDRERCLLTPANEVDFTYFIFCGNVELPRTQ